MTSMRLHLLAFATLGFCAWLGLQASKMPEFWVQLVIVHTALLLCGPGMVLLDIARRGMHRYWLYRIESLLRTCIYAFLAFGAVSNSWWSLLAALAQFVLLHHLLSTTQPTQFVKHREHIEYESETQWWVIIGAPILGFMSISTTASCLHGLAMLMLMGWRDALWNGVDQPLSKDQHRTIWSLKSTAAQEQQYAMMWCHMNTYFSQYMLVRLSLEELLTFFDFKKQTQFNTKTNLFGDNDDGAIKILDAHVKAAIAAKEPSAQFLWELYREEDAVALLKSKNMVSPQSSPTLALPSLEQ